jgi:ABC-2 type transport system ATP-binding protein
VTTERAAGAPFAIRVENAGKRYTKYEDTPMLVSSLLQLRNRTRRSKLWALRNATFTIGHGECVGVIGRNGSGKSTLLQMLAGVTAPTEGLVAVNGRVAPLISVGVGFHPELTGRENVYVNATILGLTRDEVDERFDEIVAFSEIGPFIDTPVKFYSSGMFVRLGFSVSVLAEPDVLLVDEVLAVGDMAFQMKCFERIDALRAAGTTIVIVTHNLNAVRRLCDRTVVIHAGEVRHDGDTVEAISLFHDLLGQLNTVEDDLVVGRVTTSEAAEIESMELFGPDGLPTRHSTAGETLALEATIRFREVVPDAVLALVLFSEGGVHVYAEQWLVTELADGRVLEPGESLKVHLEFDAELATGSFSVQVGLGSGTSTQIARPPAPILFFNTGRARVRGVADLQGRAKHASAETVGRELRSPGA